MTTPIAKPSVFRILVLAFWAFHFFTFIMKLKIKRVVASAGVLISMISAINLALKFL
jgi:hypothetical protein